MMVTTSGQRRGWIALICGGRAGKATIRLGPQYAFLQSGNILITPLVASKVPDLSLDRSRVVGFETIWGSGEFLHHA